MSSENGTWSTQHSSPWNPTRIPVSCLLLVLPNILMFPSHPSLGELPCWICTAGRIRADLLIVVNRREGKMGKGTANASKHARRVKAVHNRR